MLGCIRQELLSGAQPDERFLRLRDYLRFFPNLPVDAEDDEYAAKCYNICRSKGIQGGMFDLLICAQSIRHQLKVFTIDSDFERFAAHLPIELHSPSRRR
jgi:predicted nucleic acid-binding protein